MKFQNYTNITFSIVVQVTIILVKGNYKRLTEVMGAKLVLLVEKELNWSIWPFQPHLPNLDFIALCQLIIKCSIKLIHFCARN